MRTQVANLDPMSLQRFGKMKPVAVRCVEDFRSACAGKGRRYVLSVRAIKAAQRTIRWKLFEVNFGTDSGSDVNSFTPSGVCLVIPKPFHKGVPNARLTFRAQVFSVLIKYPMAIIDDRDALLHLLKSFNTDEDVIRTCLGRAIVGHDGNVDVHNE